jgi:hypothetical protein
VRPDPPTPYENMGRGRSRNHSTIPRIPGAANRAAIAAAGRATRAKAMPPGIICIPSMAQMWTMSAYAIFAGMQKPEGSFTLVEGPASIAEKRNVAVRHLLERSQLEWILFMDSDMVPETDTLLRLWQSKREIVSGLYFQRSPPYPAAAGWHGGTPERPELRNQFVSPADVTGGMIQVDFVGAGCLLVRREVFERVPSPWFLHPDQTPGGHEDVYFCAAAQEAGFPIWLHTGVVPGHMSAHPIGLEFVRAMEPAMDDAWAALEGFARKRQELIQPCA